MDHHLHSEVRYTEENGVSAYLTLRAVDVILEMFDDAALAEGVEALGHRGGVHQVARADLQATM